MNYNNMDLGRTIKMLRKLHNISQERLAYKADLTQQHISRIEQGANTPNIETLIKLSEALHVSIDVMVNTNDKLTNRRDLIILEKIKILNEDNKNKVLGYIDALLDMSV